jgi:hypothetical protein
MAPGSRSKRVRASDQSEVLTSRAQTRSSKRVQTAERDGENVQEPTNAQYDIPDSSTTPGPADHDRTPGLADHDRTTHVEEDNGAVGLDSTAAGLDSIAAGLDSTAADEDNVAQDDGIEGKLQFLCQSI